MFATPLLRAHEVLHPLAKFLAAEVDLSDELLPRVVERSSPSSNKLPILFACAYAVRRIELIECPTHFQPFRRRVDSGGRPIVAPCVIARVFDDARANRIQ